MTHHATLFRRMAAAAMIVPVAGILAASLAIATDDPSLDQEIDDEQRIATDPAVLSDGHVDIGPHYVDGEWTLLVHDDTANPPVWRRMDSTVFQVGDSAVLEVPDSDAYAFLPAEPGTPVHVVPQAQQPDVVWVGWNTQDPEVMENIDRGATLRLRGVQGPGEVVMFLQSGDLGAPDVLWDRREAYPQDVWVQVNTHTHANWVFSEPGVYLVEVEVTADLISGEAESDTEVLRFAVGDQTSTDEALAAEYTKAGDEEAQQESDPNEEATADDPGKGADTGTGQADKESSDGVATGVLIAGGAGLLLVVAVVAVVLRGRAVKKRVDAEQASAAGRQGGSAS